MRAAGSAESLHDDRMGADDNWVEMRLARIVQAEDSDSQFIYLVEVDGKRGFAIMIGAWEASEMYRIVHGVESKRPLTHQLFHTTIKALGASLKRVDLVDLRDNTYFAQLVLENRTGDVCAVVDSRPSDAIALALRARCTLRVAEHVLLAASQALAGETPPPEGDSPPDGPPEPEQEEEQEEE